MPSRGGPWTTVRVAGGTVGVVAGPVLADDRDAGMAGQPRGERVGVAVGQQVDRPAGEESRSHGAVVVARRKARSSTPISIRSPDSRSGRARNSRGKRDHGYVAAQCARHPGAGVASERECHARPQHPRRRRPTLIALGQTRHLLTEDSLWTVEAARAATVADGTGPASLYRRDSDRQPPSPRSDCRTRSDGAPTAWPSARIEPARLTRSRALPGRPRSPETAAAPAHRRTPFKITNAAVPSTRSRPSQVRQSQSSTGGDNFRRSVQGRSLHGVATAEPVDGR